MLPKKTDKRNHSGACAKRVSTFFVQTDLFPVFFGIGARNRKARHILTSESLRKTYEPHCFGSFGDIMTLSELQKNAKGRVEHLELSGAVRRRLQDIGFVRGAPVECVTRSPLGDPTAYFIGGALVAVRRSEARKVVVTAEI